MSTSTAEPVIVVPYDPQWAADFQHERAAISAALADLDVQIEHVGSTSVPDLDAKPIVDIQLVTRTVEDAIRAISPLVRLGYECRGEMGIPGRIYFRKGTPRNRQIHLFTTPENPEVERHLIFRDYLRAHPETARDYAQLKYALAERFRNDRAAYTDAKTDFVNEVIERARAEKTASPRV